MIFRDGGKGADRRKPLSRAVFRSLDEGEPSPSSFFRPFIREAYVGLSSSQR